MQMRLRNRLPDFGAIFQPRASKWPLLPKLALGCILLFLVVLQGCGPRYYLRRSKANLDHAIRLGAKVKSDTVYADRTVITKGDSTTIFVPVNHIKDTTIYQDRVTIRYHVRHDTIRFDVRCDPDTIRISVPVAVHNEIICPPKSNFWKVLALALGAVTVLVLLVKR